MAPDAKKVIEDFSFAVIMLLILYKAIHSDSLSDTGRSVLVKKIHFEIRLEDCYPILSVHLFHWNVD